MRMENQRIIECLAGAFGLDSRNNQLIEEMAELTQVICKINRLSDRDKTLEQELTANLLKQHYIEELADVNIVLQQLIHLVGEERVESVMTSKLQRTVDRLKPYENS